MKFQIAACLAILVCLTADILAFDVGGRWKVTIAAGGQTISGLALLNQSGGEKMTGTTEGGDLRESATIEFVRQR